MWDKITHLQRWCMRHWEARDGAIDLARHYEKQADAVRAKQLPPDEEEDKLDDHARELFDGLLDLFVGEDTPDSMPAVAGTVPVPAANDPLRTQFTVGEPHQPTKADFALQLAQDTAEAWLANLVKFVDLWNAVGVMGFACSNTAGLKELMEHIGMLKNIAKERRPNIQ